MADGSTQLAGKQRVQGVEVGVTGHITEQWDVFANYTFLDSETLEAADTAAGIAREGQALGNTPRARSTSGPLMSCPLAGPMAMAHATSASAT